MHFYVHFTWRSEMAYIQKVKRKQDVAYRVFINVDSSKRITKTFNTKRLAVQFVNSIKSDRNKLLAYTLSKSRTLLSLVIYKYLNNEYKGTRVNDESVMYSIFIKKLLTLLLFFTSTIAFAGVSFVDSFDISKQETGSRGLAFNTDGTKMFVVGAAGDDVNEYTLTTGFDVSTASFVDSFDVSSQETGPSGIAFNTDGTKMFVAGAGDDVNEYTLTTGFDVSTASFVDSFDVSSQETGPSGIAFNTDGTKMFVVGAVGDDVNEYTLTTGFDVSTASFVDSFDVSSQDTDPRGIAFNTDGTKMFVVGNIGDDVNEYTLTTGFDVSTASFVNSFDVSSQETNPYGLAFNTDGTKMFVVGYTGDDVNEYTLTTGFELINTAPTLSSSTPADGATGVAVDANIVLTFSEAVDVESGNIVIKKSSDDSTVETIDVTGSLVTGTGTTEITINPSTTLDGETGYYITIAATAFDDVDSASYAGITDSTTLNFTTVATNLPSPLDKKDVIGSIEAWNDISSEWIKFSIDNAFNRIDWLNRQRGSNQTSHQGIKLSFVNTLIDKIMNNSPGTALSDIDVVDTTASLIGSSNATLDEVSDNAESKANDIAINEAVRLRDTLIGSLNPSFGPVSGDWSMWTEGRIVIGKTDASTTASKKEIEVQAISLGIDRPVGDGDELMGFVLSIGQDDTDIGTASTNVKSDNYSISNYNVFRPNANIQIESVFGLGLIDFDTTRTDGSDTLSGTRKANQLFLTGVIRPLNRMHLGSWKFSPYSKVSAANTSLKAFSESGGATALTHNKQKLKDTAVAIGLDIHSQITRNTRSIKPFAKIEYNESSSKTTASMHYNSEDASTYTYTKRFDKKNKHWKLKLGLDLNTESGWNSSASYTREQSFGSSDDSQTSDSFSLNAVLRF